MSDDIQRIESITGGQVAQNIHGDMIQNNKIYNNMTNIKVKNFTFKIALFYDDEKLYNKIINYLKFDNQKSFIIKDERIDILNSFNKYSKKLLKNDKHFDMIVINKYFNFIRDSFSSLNRKLLDYITPLEFDEISGKHYIVDYYLEEYKIYLKELWNIESHIENLEKTNYIYTLNYIDNILRYTEEKNIIEIEEKLRSIEETLNFQFKFSQARNITTFLLNIYKEHNCSIQKEIMIYKKRYLKELVLPSKQNIKELLNNSKGQNSLLKQELEKCINKNIEIEIVNELMLKNSILEKSSFVF